MAVEFQTPISEVKNTGTSITIPIPTGWSPGDLLIAYVTKDDDNTCTPPAGWNELHDVSGGTAMNLWVGWRIAQEGDGELTWTWTGNSEDYYGVILRYTGHSATPIKASNTNTGTTESAIAPSVAFEGLAAGSLVLQMFGADNPSKSFPYDFPAQLTSRFNDEAGTIGGAGGEKYVTDVWVSPTGYNDPGELWDNEEKAYDLITITDGAKGTALPEEWSTYVEFTVASMACSKVRLFKNDSAYTNIVSLEVFYSGDWHNIFEGSIAGDEWVEKEIGSTQNVTAMRVKYFNSNEFSTYTAYIREVALWLPLGIATGNTGTAVFGLSYSEQWAAATVIIEAKAAVSGLSMKWNGQTIAKWNGVVINKLNGIT